MTNTFTPPKARDNTMGVLMCMAMMMAIGSCCDEETKARKLQADLKESQASVQEHKLQIDVLRRQLTDELARHPDRRLLAPPAELTLPIPGDRGQGSGVSDQSPARDKEA